MSYAGQFNVMAVADAQGYPDIGIFARGVHDELRALNDAVRPHLVGQPQIPAPSGVELPDARSADR
jgi:hypothetical protein